MKLFTTTEKISLNHQHPLSFCCLLPLLLLACQTEPKNNENTDGNWLYHGLNYAETRFSPLTQINKENINQLTLDWSLNLGVKARCGGYPYSEGRHDVPDRAMECSLCCRFADA